MGILAVGWVFPLAAAPAVVPAKPRPIGEKIEFTAPSRVTPMKPVSGSELPGRGTGSGRRDTPADGVDMITSMPLPAPTDVNRLRILQELLGRRRQADGVDFEQAGGGTGMKLDDGMDVEGAGTRMSIDDLFDRQRSRLGAEDRDKNEERRPGGARDDRSGRDRDRDRDRAGDAGDGSLAGDRESREGRAASANGGTSDGTQDKRFIPQVNSNDSDFRDSLLGRKRDSDDTGTGGFSDRAAGNWGMGLRDREDPSLAREERMEAFRRILGGGTTVDSWLSTGSRTAIGDARVVPGLAVSGPGTGAARTLGDALDARGGAAAGPTFGGDVASDRTFAAPSRPVELNLGMGRNAQGISDASAVSAAPALRPMELFQRKHDTRIPSRGF